MDALATTTEEMLRLAKFVSQLEEVDSTLVDAGHSLWDELTRAEDAGDTDTYDLTLHRLGAVGILRGEVARRLQLARAEGQL